MKSHLISSPLPHTLHCTRHIPTHVHTYTRKHTNSALFVFFGALAGIGYVDPDIASNTPAAAQPAREFVVGEPVFDPSDAQLEREARAAEQRALEEVWARQKRPNAVSYW